jgi:transcriptional regulator GlxA family with amidase domain
MLPKMQRDFEFLLFDGFSNFVLSCAMEPLRDIKIRAGRRRANWCISSINGAPVFSSSGLQIVPDKAFSSESSAKRVVLVSGYNIRNQIDKNLLASIRNVARNCETIIALDTASWILASAGLLDGHEATIHWQEYDNFVDTFPNVLHTNRRFIHSDKFHTCGTASGALDLILALAGDLFGPSVAMDTSNMFVYSPEKISEKVNQALHLDAGVPEVLSKAIDLITDNIETPLTTRQIALSIGVSSRSLHRVFIKNLQTTPGKYASLFRLKQANYLSQETQLSIEQIASRCGYSSAASLCRSYKNAFSKTLRNKI